MLGRCEYYATNGGGAHAVFYDTSGEFVMPVSQRSPEWTAAMSNFSPRAVLLEKEGRAERILGDFYEVEIFPNEFDGDDERR